MRRLAGRLLTGNGNDSGIVFGFPVSARADEGAGHLGEQFEEG